MITNATDTRTTLRIPPELHDRIRRAAERERRSVHAQILVLIEHALDELEGKK